MRFYELTAGYSLQHPAYYHVIDLNVLNYLSLICKGT